MYNFCGIRFCHILYIHIFCLFAVLFVSLSLSVCVSLSSPLMTWYLSVIVKRYALFFPSSALCARMHVDVDIAVSITNVFVYCSFLVLLRFVRFCWVLCYSRCAEIIKKTNTKDRDIADMHKCTHYCYRPSTYNKDNNTFCTCNSLRNVTLQPKKWFLV